MGLLWWMACAGSDDPGSNVLIILLDDVGAINTEATGAGALAAPTPTLDVLAAQGLRLDNAWSMPLCSPTRAALLTGRYPSRSGVGLFMEAGSPFAGALPDAEMTIPEMLDLSPRDFTSSFVGKWHLSTLGWNGDHPVESVEAPGRQGFDTHAGTVGNVSDYFEWDRNDNGEVDVSTTYVTTWSVDRAIERVKRMPEPWFLYLSLQAAHGPFHDPPGTSAATPLDQYLNMVTHADAEIGRVVDALPRRARDRTTIVVLGDNGFPNWGLDEEPPELVGRVKGSAYENGVRVPFVVWGPAIREPGRRSDALVNVVDLMPTIAELAEVDPAALPEIDGVSLLPLFEDPEARVRDTMYTEAFVSTESAETWAVRDEQYKLLVQDDWQYATFLEEVSGLALYDLETDPGETIDRSDDPDLADVMARLTGEAERIHAFRPQGL